VVVTACSMQAWMHPATPAQQELAPPVDPVAQLAHTVGSIAKPDMLEQLAISSL
jgi:hypothetical protein